MAQQELCVEDVNGERAQGVVRWLVERARAGEWTYLTDDGHRIAAVVPLDGPALDHHDIQPQDGS